MTPQEKNQTIKQTATKKKKEKEAYVNFEQIDELRKYVREWRKEYLTKTTSGKKVRNLISFSYHAAYFQVGRAATYVRFVRINLPEAAVTKMAKQMALQFKDWTIYYHHRDLYVYLRGTAYWERTRA